MSLIQKFLLQLLVILIFFISFPGFVTPVAAQSNCFSTPQVSGQTIGISPPRTLIGEDDTTIQMVLDGQEGTGFKSTHDNWQYIQIDYGCIGTFRSLDRFMSGATGSPSGRRGEQGEAVSYSEDGRAYIPLSGDNTSGWEDYKNYATTAWHSVSYGWSGPLTLNTPDRARYVRFKWDGDSDILNELKIAWSGPNGICRVVQPTVNIGDQDSGYMNFPRCNTVDNGNCDPSIGTIGCRRGGYEPAVCDCTCNAAGLYKYTCQ